MRALEHAAAADGIVRGGEGLATNRIGRSSRLRVVDALLSGTHERGSSHHELLRAFADDETIDRMDQELDARGYLTHEFGDSVFLEKQEAEIAGPRRGVWARAAQDVSMTTATVTAYEGTGGEGTRSVMVTSRPDTTFSASGDAQHTMAPPSSALT